MRKRWKKKLNKKMALFLAVLMMISAFPDLNVSYAFEEEMQSKTNEETKLEPDETKEESLKEVEINSSDSESTINKEQDSKKTKDDSELVEKFETKKDSEIDKKVNEELKEEKIQDDELENLSIIANIEDESDNTIITLSGLMPKNAVIKAKKVEVDLKDNTQRLVLAYDISIFDQDGKEFEPIAGYPINVDIKNQNLINSNEISIYHMDNQDSPQTLITKFEKKDDTVKFEADSFSIYCVTEKNTHKYVFYIDDVPLEGKNGTQIIKDAEKILKPETPYKENHKFLGWEVYDGDTLIGDLEFDNENKASPIEPITETKELKVKAKFEQIVYIYFMDSAEEDARVFISRSGRTGEQLDISDVRLPLNSRQSVIGWYLNRDLSGEPVSDLYTLGNQNIKLWPKIAEGNFLYFNTGDDGPFVEPQFVAANSVTKQPTKIPTKPGYEFLYWSEFEGWQPYQFGLPLLSDKTLHAVWQPKLVNYTVVFWKQSINDSKNATNANKTYDYAGSYQGQAYPSSLLSASTYDTTQRYTGFHYSRNSGTTEVKADGTTILNIYYDRNLMTINFYDRHYILLTPYWTLGRTITGLYGQTLAQNGYTWPSDKVWQVRYNYSDKSILTFLDAFIFDELDAESTNQSKDTLVLRDKGPSGGPYRIRFYKQNLDGTYSGLPVNTVRSDVSNFTFTNKYTGFSLDQYRKGPYGSFIPIIPGDTISINDDVYVYFERNDYELAFYNHNSVAKREQKIYEEPLNTANYVPPRPVGIPEEYEFQGWFKDRAYTEEFDFNNEIMPAHDLMIFAKWAPPELTGTFHHNLYDDGTVYIKKIYYNQTIDRRLLPTVRYPSGSIVFHGGTENIVLPENHKWFGWSTKRDDGTYILYNFDNKVLRDVELFPYSVNTQKYTISYLYNNQIVKIDENQYAENAYARLSSSDGIEFAPGKVFLGWKLKGDTSGTLYYPTARIVVKGNMEYEAVLGDIKANTKLVYRPGVVDGSEITQDSIIINDTITLSDSPYTKEGYEFIGWKSTNGKIYKAGSKVIIDEVNEDSSNIFTAIWAKKITVNKIWQGERSNTDIPIKLLRDGKEFIDTMMLTNSVDGINCTEEERYLDSSDKLLISTEDSLTWYVDAQIDGKYTVEETVPDGYTAIYDQENLNITNIKDAKINVSNQLTGNMADKNDSFVYNYKILDGTNLIKSGSFILKDGEEFSDIFVPYGFTLEIEQIRVNDYNTSVNGESTNLYKWQFAENIQTKNIAFINEKNVIIPTGIVDNQMPIIAILITSLILSVAFIKKKRLNDYVYDGDRYES